MNLSVHYIARLFTFLAGLIILAHAVVAHHHHFELSHSPEQESGCESIPQEENTKNPDSHCHAFNILVSGNATNFSLKNSLAEYFNFYLTGVNANIEIQLVKKVTTTLFGKQTIFIKQYFVTSQSLRGPPAYA